MNGSFKARVALIGLIAVLALGVTPAQAARLYFGTQDYLRRIQDVDIKGPKGEDLYLGYKYSHHSFLLPYGMSVEGHILGVSGQQSYYRLDSADVTSFQARGLLPTPLPPYELSALDYALGYLLWPVLVVIAGLLVWPIFAKRRRKRAEPHLNDGIEHHRSGNLDKAIESYTKAVEVDPKFAAAFNLRGKAFAAKRDVVRSISDHTKAIRIEPKFVGALMDRGTLMHATGNFDGAISDFSRVIKVTKDAAGYFHRGLSYLGKNDFRWAVADFTKVIKSAPVFAEAYHQRALAYGNLGELERAQADHAKARDLGKAQAAA